MESSSFFEIQGDTRDSGDQVEIRRIIQLPSTATHEVFLLDGDNLFNAAGTSALLVHHFNTLLNSHPEQATEGSGGNVQPASQTTLKVYVPKSIIASGQGAHRFWVEAGTRHSAFDLTRTYQPGRE